MTETKRVPVEPTEEMLEAARNVKGDLILDGWSVVFARLYKAMLAAAPEPSAVEEGDLHWLMNAAEGGHDNIISCGMAARLVSALDGAVPQLGAAPPDDELARLVDWLETLDGHPLPNHIETILKEARNG